MKEKVCSHQEVLMTQYIKAQKTDKVLDLQETKWVKQEHFQTAVVYFAGSLILFYNGYLF